MRENNKHILRAIKENCGKGLLLLEPRKYYDVAIVATCELPDGTHIVYDEALLIDATRKMLRCNYTEAVEFYEYNTVRSLPYYVNERGPVVIKRK